MLILCDEVLNFLSRHRDKAEPFRDFLCKPCTNSDWNNRKCRGGQPASEQTGNERLGSGWQDIVVKEVNRVAKNLISNDETEISEVVRRRLFEDLGNERTRKNVDRKFLPIGALSEGRSFPLNGRQWIRQPPKLRARMSSETLRSLLSIPSSYAIRLPKKMAGPSSLPTDTRSSGHACPVDILGLSRRVPARDAKQAFYYPGLSPAGYA